MAGLRAAARGAAPRILYPVLLLSGLHEEVRVTKRWVTPRITGICKLVIFPKKIGGIKKYVSRSVF